MTLQVIGFSQSNFVRTVRMIAEEKGIVYEHIVAIPGSKEAREVHPMGQVPGMKHNGLTLFESQAIARYLEEAFDGPSLMAGNPSGDAIINQWIALVSTTVDQFLMRRYVVEYVFNKDENGNPVRTLIDTAVPRFKRIFATLDLAVEGGYLAGDIFTMADCFLVPIIAAASNFPEAKSLIEDSPNLQSWFARVSERDSFTQTAN